MADLIHFDGRKWPDRLHWQMHLERLGDDEYGSWLLARGTTIAQRGHEPPRRVGAGFVMCVPAEEWWVVEFYWDHPWHQVYVNIGTPPEWDGSRVTQIDLDLDVARVIDGSVVVLDEDEFAEHRVEFGYPDDLIAAARTATRRAVALLEGGVEPFGSASARWLEIAGSSG